MLGKGEWKRVNMGVFVREKWLLCGLTWPEMLEATPQGFPADVDGGKCETAECEACGVLQPERGWAFSIGI